MSSYWSSENVVQIGEHQVSIPAEQGLSYRVGATSRRVSFDVPAQSVEMLSGKDSYLEFDMDIQSPTHVAGDGNSTRLQLDPAGAGMICQNIRIYDGGRGNLIEEINEYNQIVALKHDYDKDDSLKGVRGLEQGATTYNPLLKGTRGSSKSDMADIQTNPWFKAVPNITQDQATAGQEWDGNVRKSNVHCCVPLLSGIFTGSVYPNMLTGLYIEIDLMPAPRIIRQLDSVVKSRRRTLNPYLWGLRNAAGGAVIDIGGAGGNTLPAGNGALFDGAWLSLQTNSIVGVDSCPFVVGESIGFAHGIPGTANFDQEANTETGAPLQKSPIITKIEVDAAQGNRILLSFDDDYTNSAGGGAFPVRTVGVNIAGANVDTVLFSDSASQSVRAAQSFPVSYNVNNLNLVCHVVDMDAQYKSGMLQKARDGSAIEFDIHSMTNYKNSMLASERQASFLIHAQNRKAKSLCVIPTDSTVYTTNDLISSTDTYETTADEMDGVLNSARSGISGCCDFLSQVQYQINGNLVPSRPVSTRKIATRKSIDAFHIFELEKTLANANITPHSFSKFMDNFVVGRGFAHNSGVMDLRDKDLSVQLSYEETTAPSKPKMMSSFVFHIRRVMIRGGSTTVIE